MKLLNKLAYWIDGPALDDAYKRGYSIGMRMGYSKGFDDGVLRERQAESLDPDSESYFYGQNPRGES